MDGKFLSNVATWTKKNAPTILTAFGISSGLTAIALAVYYTPKAKERLDKVKKETKEKSKKEKAIAFVKNIAPCYIPAAIAEGVSIACIIGSTTISVKRQAALATAYTLSETAFADYKAKVIEKIGEKKATAIEDDIAKDKINSNPVSKNEVIIASSGNTLFYDSVSGRYFMSDIETVRRIENIMNKRLMTEMYIGLNELYYEIGLRPTEQGNELGFNINDGFIEFRFSAQMADDGRPCIVLGYTIGPRYGYGDLH